MKTHASCWLVKLLMTLLLPGSISAITCSSRFYCNTAEIKYISMDKISNVYLNATAVKEHTTKDEAECQRFCINEEHCQSVNMNISVNGSLHCQLLAINIYSNSSLLLQSSDFIHLYIPNKCRTNPCKNNATCVPIYKTDSYNCECKSNGTWITRGIHCEILLEGYASAFYYWSFNDKNPVPWTSSNVAMKRYVSGGWDSVMEPGRKNAVVKCKDGASCIQLKSNIPCINTFNADCLKLTYSIWIKYKKYQESRASTLLKMSSGGSRRGPNFYSDKGTGFHFDMAVTTNKKWFIDNFGKMVVKTKWNQFVFTLDDNVGACAFINGKKEKCQHIPTSVSLSFNSAAMRIGGSRNANSESDFFIDDLAIWKIVLSDEEVQILYNGSKM